MNNFIVEAVLETSHFFETKLTDAAMHDNVYYHIYVV